MLDMIKCEDAVKKKKKNKIPPLVSHILPCLLAVAGATNCSTDSAGDPNLQTVLGFFFIREVNSSKINESVTCGFSVWC